jgi:hypothetical protein
VRGNLCGGGPTSGTNGGWRTPPGGDEAAIARESREREREREEGERGGRNVVRRFKFL